MSAKLSSASANGEAAAAAVKSTIRPRPTLVTHYLGFLLALGYGSASGTIGGVFATAAGEAARRRQQRRLTNNIQN